MLNNQSFEKLSTSRVLGRISSFSELGPNVTTKQVQGTIVEQVSAETYLVRVNVKTLYKHVNNSTTTADHAQLLEPNIQIQDEVYMRMWLNRILI